MRFATYIFDAKSHQDPALTVFLHFARPVPSEMKITKISPARFLGRPGGMRRGAGGDMRGSEICKFWFEDMDFCFGFDTPCLGFRPRAADSSATRIPPGQAWGPWRNKAIIHIFANVFDVQISFGSCKFSRWSNNTFHWVSLIFVDFHRFSSMIQKITDNHIIYCQYCTNQD